MLKNCAMKALGVKKRWFLAVEQECKVCAGSLSFGSLWLLRTAQTPSLPQFLAVLLKHYLCQVFHRSKAFVPGLLVVCLYLKNTSL